MASLRLGYGLGFDSPEERNALFLRQRVHTGSVATRLPIQPVREPLSLGVKGPEREAARSLSSVAKVNNT